MQVPILNFTECREEVKLGNTREAIGWLDKINKSLKKEDDEIILIMGRYNRIKKNYLNLGDAQSFDRGTNQINYQILEKLNDLESVLKMNNKKIQPNLDALENVNHAFNKLQLELSELELRLFKNSPYQSGLLWLSLINFNVFVEKIPVQERLEIGKTKILEICEEWRENIKHTIFMDNNTFALKADSFFLNDFLFYKDLVYFFQSLWTIDMGEKSYLRIGGILEILSSRAEKIS